jgi:hypothetical protein
MTSPLLHPLFILFVVLLGRIGFCDPSVSFKMDIARILNDHCVSCHGAKSAEGGYRLDSFASLGVAGDSGRAPIAPSKGALASNDVGNSDAPGELLRRVISTDQSERMPKDLQPLSAAELSLLSRWFEQGALFDGDKLDQHLNLVAPPKTYADPPASYARPIPIAAVAFSPDGTHLLTSGYYEILIWRLSDLQLVRRVRNVGQRTYAIRFLSDASTIAVACGEPGCNGELRLFDFHSGALKQVLARSNDVVLDVAVRPHANQIAVASSDGTIRIIDCDGFQEIRVLASHSDWVQCVAWSDDGNKLISGGRDKAVKVFDASTWNITSSHTRHAASVHGVAFSADGLHGLSVGADKKMRRWEVENGKKVIDLELGSDAFHILQTNSFAFLPCSDRQLKQVDLGSTTMIRSFTGHEDQVLSIDFDPLTQIIATGAQNGEVRIWNSKEGSLIHTWIAKP